MEILYYKISVASTPIDVPKLNCFN